MLGEVHVSRDACWSRCHSVTVQPGADETDMRAESLQACARQITAVQVTTSTKSNIQSTLTFLSVTTQLRQVPDQA